MGPAKLMNETAVHTRLLPRISPTGRRWMSMRADIRSPICTAPDSTMLLFCPVLRSLHYFPAMAVPPRSRVSLQLYGAVGKVFLSSLGHLADQDYSEFSLRGAHRIIVAYGCSRLRSDLRWRRPCGHAAPARARGGSVRTGRGRRPVPAARTADRTLELLEPCSDPLRPVRRRKLAESQGGTDAGRARSTIHPAPSALYRRVRPHSRRTENHVHRVAPCLGPLSRAPGQWNVRGHHGRRRGACRLGVR